jgi:hypothetical protein
MESYYREQAVLCANEAAASTLPNVKARCSRAEAAWLDMAERTARHTRFKQGPAVSGGVEAGASVG